MKTQRNPKAIFRVTTPAGDTCDHVYDLPAKPAAARALVSDLLAMIQNAASGRKDCCYIFSNPLVYYNPAFVASVRLTYVDCEDCADMVASITKNVCKQGTAGRGK